MEYQPSQDKEIEDWAEELVQEYQLYLQRKEDEKQMIQEAFDVLSRTVKEPKKRLKRA